MSKNEINISRFLSLVLRHNPEKIGIHLDQNGWADVNELISKINLYGIRIDRETLDYIVTTNNKKRFKFNDTLDKIRASQGHSVNVDMGYSPQKPPEILYHGTAEKFVESILVTGLEKKSRQYVHLSSDIETAMKVGQRHGKPIIFIVLALQMYLDHFQFFISENGVWLTDHVPEKYLKRVDD